MAALPVTLQNDTTYSYQENSQHTLTSIRMAYKTSHNNFSNIFFSFVLSPSWATSNGKMHLKLSQASSHIFLRCTSHLILPIFRIMTSSALPKIDGMQQIFNPLERFAALFKYNRWPCKRYHFSWIESLLCHLCWLSLLSINLCMTFRKLMGSVSNQFICMVVTMHRKYTTSMGSLKTIQYWVFLPFLPPQWWTNEKTNKTTRNRPFP